jgi:methionine-S-sulfoxide reductase
MRNWGAIAAAACGFTAIALVLVLGMRAAPIVDTHPIARRNAKPYPSDAPPGKAKATFAAGCFWCTEAVFQKLKGVEAVVSGYTGGTVMNPSYEEVCSEMTGHAEAIDVIFDPKVVSYDTLLEVFWKTHDATTPNQQGNDVGTRYRSAIFYHDDEQRKIAESYKQKLEAAGFFRGTIVTEIVPAMRFYKAEDYHQNYFNEHTERRYCRMIIGPKLEKLRHVFAEKLKAPAE